MSAPRNGDRVRYRWKGLFGNPYEARTMVCGIDPKGRPGTPTVGSSWRLNYHDQEDDVVVTQRAIYLEPEQVAAVQRIIDSCDFEVATFGVIPMTREDLTVLREIVKAAAL